LWTCAVLRTFVRHVATEHEPHVVGQRFGVLADHVAVELRRARRALTGHVTELLVIEQPQRGASGRVSGNARADRAATTRITAEITVNAVVGRLL
jgi:hypothetical protein